MRFHISCVVAAAFGALLVPSRAHALGRPTEWLLPSGLVVLHQPDTRFPVVRVLVTVGGGTADTAPGQRPLAHLAEHVAFRADLGEGSAFQVLRAAGCAVNGTTRLDTTTFQMECPRDAAALAVSFAAAVATHDFAGIEEEDISAEARVVLAETTQGLDRGVAVDDEATFGVFTGDHPYHQVVRVPDDLLALRRADVDAFFRAHYVPEQVVIAVGGDIDAGALAGLLSRSAGDGFAHPRQRRGEVADWPAGAIPVQWIAPFSATWFRDPDAPDQPLGAVRAEPKAARPQPPVPEPETEPHTARHSGTWPMVQVAWYLPPADHKTWIHLQESEVYANDTLRHVFDAPEVISGDCTALLGTRGSALFCYAAVESEDQMARVGRRIAEAFKNEVTYVEEKRLLEINDIDARTWRAIVRRDRSGVAELEDLSMFRLATGRFDLESERTAAFTGAGGFHGWAELRSAWLRPERAVTTFVEPEPRASMVPEGAVEGAGALAWGSRWPVPPLGIVAGEEADIAVLENGLHTIVLPVPGARIGAWRLSVPSLPGFEYLEPVVDAALRTPDRFEGNPLYYGWFVRGADDGTVLELNQKGTWEPRHLLRSLWGTVEAQRIGDVKLAFNRYVQRTVYAGRSPYTWIHRAWRRATREDPERDGLPEIHEAIRTPGAVEAYLTARYQPDRATLVLIGNEVQHARERIPEEMGDWRASAPTPPALPVARSRAPTPETIVFDNNGVGKTVSVTWACPVSAGATPVDPLTAALLGTVASDRLFDVVRATNGLSYTPVAWTESRWGGVDLYLSASTELGQEATVLSALRAAAADLGSGRADAWLDAGRREVLADELRKSSSILGLASTMSRGVLLPGSLPALRARRAALAEVDGRAVAALLQTCATVGVAMVVGPADEVAHNLAGGDLPVRVFDWRAAHIELVRRWLPAVTAREVAWLERARGE